MMLSEIQQSVQTQMDRDWKGYDFGDKVTITVLGLAEEVGEVAGLLRRVQRDPFSVPDERWLDEVGDVLWYLVAACNMLGMDLDTVWENNCRKLRERYGD